MSCQKSAGKRAVWSTLNITTDEMEEKIDQWIFDERARKMLKRRIIDHITFEQLAEEFELSVRQTNTIIQKNSEILLRHI